MGKYFQGDSIDKGQDLVLNHGARQVTREYAASVVNDEKLVPICVVDNGLFEAAALMFNLAEFLDFSLPEDTRSKRWYIMDREKSKTIFH